jgi:hypothetical protein
MRGATKRDATAFAIAYPCFIRGQKSRRISPITAMFACITYMQSSSWLIADED